MVKRATLEVEIGGLSLTKHEMRENEKLMALVCWPRNCHKQSLAKTASLFLRDQGHSYLHPYPFLFRSTKSFHFKVNAVTSGCFLNLS